MDKSQIIVWEKWRDPLGYDDIEEKFSEENLNHTDDIEDEDIQEDEEPSVFVKKIKDQFALTPLGLIPLTENTVSSKIFNFWTGHTTFTISAPIANIIENVDGIETLDIFTRYRFRVSVGKAFKDSVVLRDVNDSIYNFLIKESII